MSINLSFLRGKTEYFTNSSWEDLLKKSLPVVPYFLAVEVESKSLKAAQYFDGFYFKRHFVSLTEAQKQRISKINFLCVDQSFVAIPVKNFVIDTDKLDRSESFFENSLNFRAGLKNIEQREKLAKVQFCVAKALCSRAEGKIWAKISIKNFLKSI